MNFSISNSGGLSRGDHLERVITSTTVFVLFGFLEEWERLSNFRSSHSTRAAINFRDTVGIFTNEFALGFGASGFVAFPVTFRFFAYWFAFWFGSLAMSNAMGLFANSDALRAVKHFTSFVWAFNFTFGFFAFNVANGIFGFST